MYARYIIMFKPLMKETCNLNFIRRSNKNATSVREIYTCLAVCVCVCVYMSLIKKKLLYSVRYVRGLSEKDINYTKIV